MNNINKGYLTYSQSDPDLDIRSNRKVGKGGLCFLWKKELDNRISVLKLSNPFIIGIQLQIEMNTYAYIFQSYLPCSKYSVTCYEQCLEDIENVINSYCSKGHILLMGDVNAELPSNSCNISHFTLDKRGTMLCKLLSRFDLIPANCLPLCLGPDCTNVPYSRGRETLLDYVFVEENCMHNIFSCSILDDDATVLSTHRPVLFTLRFCKSLNDDRGHFKNPMNINWKHVNESVKCCTLYSDFAEQF